MEVHSDLVRSTGGNVVLYGEDPRALVQLERAAVQDRIRQSRITVVLADHLASLDSRLPGNAACTRSWTPQKRAKHEDRKSTRLNSSHSSISYAVFCLKK